MNHALAVAAREVKERWLLFPAGLVVGLVPFVGPAFGIQADLIEVGAPFLAILVGAIAALVAGASMLARDTADGRLAFLFARPVPWEAIWGGKWLAAVVLVFGSFFLALLPVSILYPSPSPSGLLVGPDGSALFLVLLLLGIGFANFNATAFRSRSAWLALDLGLLLVASRLVAVWVAPLYALLLPVAHAPAKWTFMFLGLPALAFLLASGVQVRIGRTDLRRAHRALSVTFWACIFAALATAGVRLAWARAATPADLSWGWSEAGSSDPTGRWLHTTGRSARGGLASFLIDTDSGDYVPLGVSSRWGSPLRGIAFDAQGHTGALLSQRGDGSALAVAKLGEGKPRFQWVQLESSPPPDPRMEMGHVLSPSGATAALVHRHGVSLFSLPSGQRVATATVPAGWRPVVTRMLAEGHLRVWLIPVIDAFMADVRDEARVLDLRVDQEPRLTAVQLEEPVGPFARPSPDVSGERILTWDGGVRLRDGATGALLATLVETESGVSARFVADGRVVVGEAVGAQTLLRVFAADGSPLKEATVERVPTGLRVGRELAPGRVIITFTRVLDQPEAVIFDLEEGEVVDTNPTLRPLRSTWIAGPSVPGSVVGVGTQGRLFREGPVVVRLDIESGERRVVAGAGAHLGSRLSPEDVGLD